MVLRLPMVNRMLGDWEDHQLWVRWQMINDATAWLMTLKEWPQEARDILLASLNDYITAHFLKSYL
jgi:hypothetical protein